MNETRSYNTSLEGLQRVHSNGQEKENLVSLYNPTDHYHSLKKLEYFSDLTPRDFHYLISIMRQALTLIIERRELSSDEAKKSLCSFIECL